MKFSIKLKLMAGFGVALFLMIVMGAVSFISTVSLVNASNTMHRPHEVIDGLERTMYRLTAAETAQRSFITTGSEKYLELFNSAIVDVERELNNIRALTTDDPPQQGRLDTIEPLIQLKVRKLGEEIDLRRDVGIESAVRAIYGSFSKNQIMDALRTQVALMQDGEHRLLDQLAAESAAASTMAKLTIVVGTFMSFVILSIIAFLLSRSISVPISRLEEVVWDIGQGDLTARVQVSSNDEIGGLGIAFNRMAEGLQQACATFEMTHLELKQEVSERKQAEEEARSLAATLEVSNRDLQDFASVASHDLQEPLRKILAFGDRLNSKYGDA
jgi:CHASE3 domain sensor protein